MFQANPLREILETSALNQAKKIGRSLLVYGGIVLTCFGFFPWLSRIVSYGIFPLRYNMLLVLFFLSTVWNNRCFVNASAQHSFFVITHPLSRIEQTTNVLVSTRTGVSSRSSSVDYRSPTIQKSTPQSRQEVVRIYSSSITFIFIHARQKESR